MYKATIFDIDGVLNHAERFSDRYTKEHNVPMSKLLPFFKGPFQLCLVGKADLKEELAKVLKQWEYDENVDDLLQFWFEGEVNKNQAMEKSIRKIRKNGFKTVAATNQEKYRTDYLTRELKLTELFDEIYSSASIGVKKPEVEFYKHISLDLQTPLNEMIYWDDDIENVESAKGLGIKAFHFTDVKTFLKQRDAALEI